MLAGTVNIEGGRTLALVSAQVAAFQAEADQAIADLKGEVPRAEEIPAVQVEPEVR